MVAAVADSLDFEWKYRSAVIAWAPEDRPTDEQIEALRRRSTNGSDRCYRGSGAT